MLNAIRRSFSPCGVVRYALLVVLAAFCSILWSQQESGSITGQVQDPKDAAVPGAEVVLTNSATGASFTTASDGTGFYRAPQVVPGVYSITASAAGFGTLVQKGIVVRVNDRLRVDLHLQLRTVAERVVVEAAAPLLQTEDATTGQVVDNQKITELPLNGRNWLQLATLAPGTVSYPGVIDTGTGNPQTLVMNLGGSRTNQNNYLLDGADNNGFVTSGTAVVYPPVDSLQEFKVQTNNYTADTGQLGGAVVNATIKSGSNAVHGTAYEFLRNRSLNARNFFAPPVGKSPEFTQNQFGASTGGPVIRNKLFFFLNYEGNRQRQNRVVSTTVYTDAQKAGNFASQLGAPGSADAQGRPVLAGQIFDPFSVRRLATGQSVRDPFPGNIIPVSRMNPTSKALIDLAPQPNTAGSPNFVKDFSAPLNLDTYVGRVDFTRTSKDTVFGHFVYSDQDSHTSPSLGLPLDGGTSLNINSDQRAVQLGWTRVFRPTDLNEFRIAYLRNASLRSPEQSNIDLNKRFGVGINMPDPNVSGLSLLTISGYSSIGSTNTFHQLIDKYEVSDTYTAIRGPHLFKFGFRAGLKLFYNQSNCNGCRGGLTFDGVFTRQVGFSNTGNAVADFLMGVADSAALKNLTNEKDVGHALDWFVQDKWRVNSKLAITMGVRYQFNPLSWEARGQVSSVIFGRDFRSAELVVPTAQSDATFNNMKNVLFPYIGVRRAPELDRGLVHDTHLNFAPRLGIAYQLGPKTVLRTGYGIFYGFLDIVSGAVLSLNPPTRMQLSPASNTVDPTIVINQSVFGPTPFNQALNAPGFSSVRDPNIRPDLTQMYNLTVQQQLTSNWLVEIGFMGNRSSRIAVQTQVNDATPAIPSDTSAPQSRRRATTLLGNLPFIAGQGFSNYNALTLGVEKRFAQGLSLLANYTWSRALGVAPAVTEGINGGTVQNPFDLKREYGPLEFDIINRVSVSYIYDLPFGKGRHYLSNASGVVKALAGGWQLTGITVLQGGFPITPSLSSSLGKTFTNSRPNTVGDPTESPRQPYQWINPKAFAIPTNAEIAAGNFFGNTGYNTIREPGLVNFDFSVIKHFDIREQIRLQFRTEFFNATNTPFFGLPAAVATNFNAATFGKVTAAGDPRIIQFGLKLLF